MLSHGFGIGLSTRVGHLLAERKVRSAKLVAAGGLSAGLLTLCAATAGVATDAARDAWLATFTPSGNGTADAIDVAAADELVAGVRRDTELIWPSVMAFLIVDGIYALNLGLMRGLGLQLSAALATILSLWVCGLPAIFVVVLRGGGGLAELWGLLPPLYLGLCSLQALSYGCKDWGKVSEAIVARLAARETAMAKERAAAEGGEDGGGEAERLLG